VQVNHDEMVLYLGQELLDSRELDGYPVLKQDVLISMAMAKYNAARDLFATPGAQVRGGQAFIPRDSWFRPVSKTAFKCRQAANQSLWLMFLPNHPASACILPCLALRCRRPPEQQHLHLPLQRASCVNYGSCSQCGWASLPFLLETR